MKGVKSVSRLFFLSHGRAFVFYILTIYYSPSIKKMLFSVKNLTVKISLRWTL